MNWGSAAIHPFSLPFIAEHIRIVFFYIISFKTSDFYSSLLNDKSRVRERYINRVFLILFSSTNIVMASGMTLHVYLDHDFACIFFDILCSLVDRIEL